MILIHGIEGIVRAVLVDRVRRIAGIVPVHRIERAVRIVGVGGVTWVIRSILCDWVENIVSRSYR